MYLEFDKLQGLTLTEIRGEVGTEELIFICSDNNAYKLHYVEDCCGSCYLEDICGDINDLIGSPILLADEVVGGEPDGSEEQYTEYDSHTWSFYKLSTIKGSVTFRWYGSSNGYYSETVSFSAIIFCKVCKGLVSTDGYNNDMVKADDGANLCSDACLAMYHTIPLCYE